MNVRQVKAAWMLLLVAGVWLAPPAGCWAGGREATAALDAAIASVTTEQLRQHAGFLADDTLEGRAAGTRGGYAAARYLEAQLKQAGLQPAGDNRTYLQRFNPNHQNLLAVLPGTDAKLRQQYIVVGAHYDHVGYGSRRNSNGPIGYIHNGADDNASGVSVLLEMIDALSHTGWQPRRSVIFAFWDGEEINLLGSRYWVRQPTVPLANVKLAINADMVGRMTKGRLEVEGTRTAPGLRQLFSSTRLPKSMWLDFTWEYQENSDHWPFFEAGIPSMLIHTGLHGDYHRPSDDIEKLNIPGMQQTSAYLLETIFRAADEDELPSFRSASHTENAYARRERESPLAPLPPRLGMRWDWRTQEESPRLVVKSVTGGGAADLAGLRPGDQVVSVDGAPIETETLLPAAVLKAERKVTVQIKRGDSEPRDVEVKLAGQPVEFGLAWREDPAAPRSVFTTRVVPYSPADRAGVELYDRIYAVNGEPFADQDALLKKITELLAANAESIQLEVESFGRIHTVDVDLTLPKSVNNDASL